jgi:hypothetical protein
VSTLFEQLLEDKDDTENTLCCLLSFAEVSVNHTKDAGMEYAIAKSGGTFLLFGTVLVVAGLVLVVWQNFSPPTLPTLLPALSLSSLPSVPSMPPWLLSFFTRAGLGADAVNLILVAVTICLFIAGIFTLVISASSCSTPTDGAVRYEPFQNHASGAQGLVLEMKQRSEKLGSIKDGIERDLEDLSSSADDVCAILKQVEDTYITNAAAPTSADEMNLAADIQERRKADRRKRAATSFKDRMKQYVDLNGGKPLYECFDNEEESSIALATQELQDAVRETSALMNTGEVKLASLKEERIRSLMGFNATFLKKTIDTLSGVKETFANEMEGAAPQPTGRALLQRADELITQATSLHTRILALKKDVEIQRKASAGLDAKAANLGEGNFSQADVNAAKPF